MTAWGHAIVPSDGLLVLSLMCSVCQTEHRIALPRRASLRVELSCTPCPSCGRSGPGVIRLSTGAAARASADRNPELLGRLASK